MAVTEEQVIEALRPVQDPELAHEHRRARHGQGRSRSDGGRVDVTVALTVAGCPLRTEITKRVTDAVAAARRRRRGRRRADGDDRGASSHGRPGQDARPRQGSAGAAAHTHGGQPLGHEEGRPNPFMDPDSRTRILGISSGKGGVGKSSVTVNLAVALAKAGPRRRHPRRRRLRLLGPEDARHRGRPGRDRRHDRAAGRLRGAVHLDRLLRRRRPAGHVAGPDAAQGARAVPGRRLLGRPRLPARRHAARAPATWPCRWPSTCPRSEVYVVTTPQAAAQRVAQRTAYMAKKINLPLRGVIENMSWFTGDDGRRYELFGAGGGAAAGRPTSACRCSARSRWCPPCGRAATSGVPVTVTDADGEAAEAFDALAAQIVAKGRDPGLPPGAHHPLTVLGAGCGGHVNALGGRIRRRPHARWRILGFETR